MSMQKNSSSDCKIGRLGGWELAVSLVASLFLSLSLSADSRKHTHRHARTRPYTRIHSWNAPSDGTRGARHDGHDAVAPMAERRAYETAFCSAEGRSLVTRDAPPGHTPERQGSHTVPTTRAEPRAHAQSALQTRAA